MGEREVSCAEGMVVLAKEGSRAGAGGGAGGARLHGRLQAAEDPLDLVHVEVLLPAGGAVAGAGAAAARRAGRVGAAPGTGVRAMSGDNAWRSEVRKEEALLGGAGELEGEASDPAGTWRPLLGAHPRSGADSDGLAAPEASIDAFCSASCFSSTARTTQERFLLCLTGPPHRACEPGAVLPRNACCNGKTRSNVSVVAPARRVAPSDVGHGDVRVARARAPLQSRPSLGR